MSSRSLALLSITLVVGCESADGDSRTAAGAKRTEPRIADVTDPSRPGHADFLVPGVSATVTNAAVIALDAFDETKDGRSVGTLYVADVTSRDPYSGIGLFAPAFVPANLRVGPGDVLDLRGQYQENENIGTQGFAPGAVLPQLSRPLGTFRYELPEHIEPTTIDVTDLADFDKGRRWLGMLVRVEGVTLQRAADEALSGRVAAELLPPQSAKVACTDPFPKAPTLTNELFDVGSLGLEAGTGLASLTGVVTFFCNFHIAPRSGADIVR